MRATRRCRNERPGATKGPPGGDEEGSGRRVRGETKKRESHLDAAVRFALKTVNQPGRSISDAAIRS
ncbi:protein of unknown function [Pararobbsia alpina]